MQITESYLKAHRQPAAQSLTYLDDKLALVEDGAVADEQSSI
jgi:hypothetical protein